MHLKGITVEDFCNYKKPSLFLSTAECDFKCCIEQGLDISICQNSPTASAPTIELNNESIYKLFIESNITKAVVIGGLEPFLQFSEVIDLVSYFREMGEDCTFVIYTGYYPNEILHEVCELSRLDNIVIKFGRYIPNSNPIFDEVLGINLASSNQFAERITSQSFRRRIDEL